MDFSDNSTVLVKIIYPYCLVVHSTYSLQLVARELKLRPQIQIRPLEYWRKRTPKISLVWSGGVEGIPRIVLRIRDKFFFMKQQQEIKQTDQLVNSSYYRLWTFAIQWMSLNAL